MELTTPAHRRLVDELLAWNDERPVVDPDLRDHLRRMLDDGLAPVLDAVPPGERVFLGKSSLGAIVCDGRWIDQEETPFEWSPQLVGGKLAHRAIELDHAARREVPAEEVVQRAWHEFVSDVGSLADFVNGLDRVGASAMRLTAEQRVTEFRDLWPLLPPSATLRLEQRMEASFGEGAVIVRGTPDMTIGAVRDDRARMLLVDLKTGMRNPTRERQDLRLYALLATLKFGQAPFRWATYYVSEGAWDIEDHDPALLETAARRVIDGATRVARLLFDRPAESELRLVGGAWCRFCGRRSTCPAVAADPEDADWP